MEPPKDIALGDPFQSLAQGMDHRICGPNRHRAQVTLGLGEHFFDRRQVRTVHRQQLYPCPHPLDRGDHGGALLRLPGVQHPPIAPLQLRHPPPFHVPLGHLPLHPPPPPPPGPHPPPPPPPPPTPLA